MPRDDDMDGVIFYTFSTIAATFGSAVGIIIAAAIFRMQRIDQIANGLSQKVTHSHAIAEEKRERLARAALVQDWHSYVEIWRADCREVDPYSDIGHHVWLLEEVRNSLALIRLVVGMLVVASLALIMACFAGLGMTHVAKDLMWSRCNVPILAALSSAFLLLLGYGFVTWLLTRPIPYTERPPRRDRRNASSLAPR